jgi:hypothetical protein
MCVVCGYPKDHVTVQRKTGATQWPQLFKCIKDSKDNRNLSIQGDDNEHLWGLICNMLRTTIISSENSLILYPRLIKQWITGGWQRETTHHSRMKARGALWWRIRFLHTLVRRPTVCSSGGWPDWAGGGNPTSGCRGTRVWNLHEGAARAASSGCGWSAVVVGEVHAREDGRRRRERRRTGGPSLQQC